jgi:hypothetical protein
VTVQVVDALESSVAVPHCKELMVLGASREIVACLVEPLREAFRVAV